MKKSRKKRLRKEKKRKERIRNNKKNANEKAKKKVKDLRPKTSQPPKRFRSKEPEKAKEDTKAGSARARRTVGLYASLLGDPYPSLVGLNLGINLIRWLRVTAGYGKLVTKIKTVEVSSTTIGGGVKFFMPGWNLSPVVGINYASVKVTLSGEVDSATSGSITSSTSHGYVSGGLDWQTDHGLNLGAGLSQSLISAVTALPYINVGWYF